MTINSQKELILLLSKKSRFTKGDIKIILDSLIETLEELVVNEGDEFDDGETSKTLLKVRGLGEIRSVLLPERKGKDGRILPPTPKVIFRLSENIRFAGKNVVEIDEEETLTEDE